MDYEIPHNVIIERAQNRVLEDYCERHHIIPRCMGGTDDPDNLVDLTAREHYIVHQLLVKMYPGNAKLIYAAWAMTVDSHGNRVGNRRYAWLKRKVSDLREGKTYEELYGLEKALELKRKCVERMIGNTHSKGNVSPRKGKTGIYSKESLQRMSDGAKNRPPFTESTKNLMSKSASERPTVNEITKEKMRLSRAMQPKIKCPYCIKIGHISNMKRWHFDNCKLKENVIG